VHPSCYHIKQTDEHSKHDQAYQKCLSNHPQYYFNNLGVVHLKLQKYNLAIFYFSKALKFLDKSQTGNPTNQPYMDKENPNECISTLTSQKTPEILYNYGIALYKVARYEEAFRCFEKSSQTLKHHPRVWYYMALSSLYLNLQTQQETLHDDAQSDLFQRQLSWNSGPQNSGMSSYTKTGSTTQHRRFLLTP
jgi:tetratricopeptide (TPR) repeat protein